MRFLIILTILMPFIVMSVHSAPFTTSDINTSNIHERQLQEEAVGDSIHHSGLIRKRGLSPEELAKLGDQSSRPDLLYVSSKVINIEEERDKANKEVEREMWNHQVAGYASVGVSNQGVPPNLYQPPGNPDSSLYFYQGNPGGDDWIDDE